VHYDGPTTPEEEAAEYAFWLKGHNLPPTVVDAQPWWLMEQFRYLFPMWDQARTDAAAGG
jgi:hypothetical protein